MLGVLGQQDDVVDRDVGAGRRAQRLEGVGALCGLHVPHLDGAVRGGADDVVAVWGERGLVDERRVAAELLQGLTGLEAVDPGAESEFSHCRTDHPQQDAVALCATA